MSARDELIGLMRESRIVWATNTEHRESQAAQADAILAAGYSKPKVLGYIVVDRGGVMVGNQHKHEESAQAFAAEWTKDCKDAGIDWDYRVATITEES